MVCGLEACVDPLLLYPEFSHGIWWSLCPVLRFQFWLGRWYYKESDRKVVQKRRIMVMSQDDIWVTFREPGVNFLNSPASKTHRNSTWKTQGGGSSGLSPPQLNRNSAMRCAAILRRIFHHVT